MGLLLTHHRRLRIPRMLRPVLLSTHLPHEAHQLEQAALDQTLRLHRRHTVHRRPSVVPYGPQLGRLSLPLEICPRDWMHGGWLRQLRCVCALGVLRSYQRTAHAHAPIPEHQVDCLLAVTRPRSRQLLRSRHRLATDGQHTIRRRRSDERRIYVECRGPWHIVWTGHRRRPGTTHWQDEIPSHHRLLLRRNLLCS